MVISWKAEAAPKFETKIPIDALVQDVQEKQINWSIWHYPIAIWSRPTDHHGSSGASHFSLKHYFTRQPRSAWPVLFLTIGAFELIYFGAIHFLPLDNLLSLLACYHPCKQYEFWRFFSQALTWRSGLDWILQPCLTILLGLPLELLYGKGRMLVLVLWSLGFSSALPGAFFPDEFQLNISPLMWTLLGAFCANMIMHYPRYRLNLAHLLVPLAILEKLVILAKAGELNSWDLGELGATGSGLCLGLFLFYAPESRNEAERICQPKVLLCYGAFLVWASAGMALILGVAFATVQGFAQESRADSMYLEACSGFTRNYAQNYRLELERYAHVTGQLYKRYFPFI